MSDREAFSEFYSLSAPYAAVAENIVRLRMEQDLIHDIAHLVRVTRMAVRLAEPVGADLDVVIPAAILHDLVNIKKTDPRRSKASSLCAEAAVRMLGERCLPKHDTHFEQIAHAITAHSFSADIQTDNIEALVVRDADRLDAMGCIGSARCILYSGYLNRSLAHPTDPAGINHPLDDFKYCLDHFKTKLFGLQDTLSTDLGKEIGKKRHARMVSFYDGIIDELNGA